MTLDPAALRAAIAAARSSVDAVFAGDVPPSSQEVADALAAVPGVTVLGASESGVTAELGQNGPALLVLLEPAPPGLNDTALSMQSENVRSLAVAPRRDELGVMPSGKKVKLLSIDQAGIANPTSDVARIFRSVDATRPYDVTVGNATIPELRAVTGVDVLLVKAHGAECQVMPSQSAGFAPGYCLSTSEHVDLADPVPAAYFDDIVNRRVLYAYVPSTKWGPLNPLGWFTSEQHVVFGITSKFVEHYWRLNEGSLVLLEACYGGATKYAPFTQSVLSTVAKRGPATVLAWSDAAESDCADRAARVVFDRLLGANRESPVTGPKQRPFGLKSVLAEMGRSGWSECSVAGHGRAFLVRTDSGEGFELLAPTIANVDVDEANEELVIHGEFGSPEGRVVEVTFAGSKPPLTAPPESQTVRARLPAAAMGDVVVTVDGIQSNPVPITGWRGTIRYDDRQRIDYPTEQSDANHYIEFHLSFRADVHDVRKESGLAPEPQERVAFTAEGGSSALYRASGSGLQTYPDFTATSTLSGGGTIEGATPPAEWADRALAGQEVLVSTGWFDLKARKVALNAWAIGNGLISTLTTTTRDGTFTDTGSVGMSGGTAAGVSSITTEHLGDFLYGWVAPFFPDLSIAAVDVLESGAPFPGVTTDLAVSWAAMPPIQPPTDQPR